METTNEEIFDSMPDFFLEVMEKIQNLKFAEKPKYRLFIKYLEAFLQNIGVE